MFLQVLRIIHANNIEVGFLIKAKNDNPASILVGKAG